MIGPRLEYESRSRGTPGCRRRKVGGALAVLSVLMGLAVGMVLMVGFGVGDTWVIYPPAVPLYWWLMPVALVAWPIWFFRRASAE